MEAAALHGAQCLPANVALYKPAFVKEKRLWHKLLELKPSKQ
jgi:hypothetical protein